MNILVALVVGVVVGWFAGRALGRVESPLSSMIIGVIGSVLGGILSIIILGNNQSYMAFTWPSLFWSFIGSLLLVALAAAVHGSPHQSRS